MSPVPYHSLSALLCPPPFSLVSLPVPTDPPRLPRCSPERLKKSWSCQPLGDTATEPLQGRRQSGESHVSPVFLLSHVFPPHYPTVTPSPVPSCGWVTPKPVGRVALGANGASSLFPQSPSSTRGTRRRCWSGCRDTGGAGSRVWTADGIRGLGVLMSWGTRG